ncbi:MAG: formate dehydrogenase subunit alpha [Pelagibacteraceae bacterium]|nr:formate dehydrogenase subunit alpha [Pelagibacteraceae bacterium]|tara:strand:- start:2786 stop:5542 length:2757 start_codon:yes stop_codon:yes gene_type:complete
MTKKNIQFTINNKNVTADEDETIWQVSKRLGIEIPHLCYLPEPDYRADGNCRACMVEIEGERVLAASCIRKPTEGMKVFTSTDRAKKSRELVFELLLTDQPSKNDSHDPESNFWKWTEKIDIEKSRFIKKDSVLPDSSHPSMAVNLDACIQCNLCVRACREVQVNDVIGMAYRGENSKIVFDFDDPMGESTCVACGECVQACPTGALMPATVVDEKGVGHIEIDKKVDSICPYCGVGCQLEYNIKDNKILYVNGRDGPANKNRLCVKGRFGFDYVNNKDRLTKPLIRINSNNKVESLKIDPSNPLSHFRESTWEEALDFASQGLLNIKDKEGGDSLAGFGSAKCSNEEAYLFQKLIRTGFKTNNVDHCTRLCHASSVAALLETIGSGAVTAPFSEVKNSDVIIVIGANPTENHPVAATFFKNAQKNGSKLIVMDPRGQSLRKQADYMLQFNPGSDVALLNSIMHVILKEDLYDKEYINKHTLGFEKIKEHLDDFSPEKMSNICGIETKILYEVARLYGKSNNAIIFWGMGISQHTHGTDNARCLISLALMTGNIGRAGTGLHPLRGQNNVQGASDAGLIPMMYPDYNLVNDNSNKKFYEDFWGTALNPEKGLTVVEIMDAVHNNNIKGMYILGENPAMSDPDVTHARKALSKLEHLVVQDIFFTETASYADVILPASAWPEKDGTVTNTNRQVQMGRKALNLPGDAKEDWWIIIQLANKLGLNWKYSHPKDIYNEMKEAMPSLNNITWERLEKENSVTYPCDSPTSKGTDVVFGEGFPTEGGRGKFVAADIIPSDELPDKEFPMILTTGRQLEHWHTGAMTRRASNLDAIEPEPTVSLSPEDIKDINSKPGDFIKVSTRRGSIKLRIRNDSSVPKGLIFIPFCYFEAAANVLTNSALDPYGKIPEFKFCAAKLENLSQ